MGVTVAVTRAAANTSTGNQQITTTDLGGLTPKAALLIATRCVTDGTAADGGGFYVGMTDGTNERTEGYESEHAQASMDAQQTTDSTADRILTIYDGTADSVVEATADFVSLDTNGITINWTAAPASAYLLTVIFFAGTDLSAIAGSMDLGNVADATVANTSVGFEADVLLTFWQLGGSLAGGGMLSFGVVQNDRAGGVTQRCITHKQRSGFGSAAVGAVMYETQCFAKLLQTDGVDFFGAAQSFDSSGFDIQLGNTRTPANSDLAYLALRFGASPVVSSKVYTYATPTGTGSNTDAGAGFEPQFVMYLATRTATAGTAEFDGDGGTYGVVAVDADDVYTNSIGDEDGAADSNTQSLSDDQLNLPTHTGAAGQVAAFTSFGGTGVTWNWTTIDGTARQWGALAIGANAAAGGPVIPVFMAQYRQRVN